jgi:threonine aldolase
MIDLRSDTVTKPSPAMLEAMTKAELGDDVFSEDPTVRALEEKVAEIVGKESAIFVTSGTMGNQLAIALHTKPGDEVICGDGAHPVWYESGAGPALSGVQFAIAGTGGLYNADDLLGAIKPRAYWCPRTSLVCVENTHNRAGGRVFPQKDILALAARARENNLALHLDGARIWNASAASQKPVSRLAAPFDTVSVCFSKGLGAPVGSALCGMQSHIDAARRLRKMWGGGMRQAGILAAAAIYALDHNRERLTVDHQNAKRLAEAVTKSPRIKVDLEKIETNIVNIDLDGVSADAVVKAAKAKGVLIHATGPHRLRAVLHLDVKDDDVQKGADLLVEAVASLP